MDGHEHVGLGVIGCGTTFRGVVRDHEEQVRGARFSVEVAGDVDRLFILQSAISHVFAVHENHAALIGDTAVTVVVAVDRGVELVVAAKGLE